MEKTITLIEAYKSMFEFVRQYYNRKAKPRELALLLSDIELIHDGMPMDPAMWQDWLDAVDSVLEDK